MAQPTIAQFMHPRDQQRFSAGRAGRAGHAGHAGQREQRVNGPVIKQPHDLMAHGARTKPRHPGLGAPQGCQYIPRGPDDGQYVPFGWGVEAVEDWLADQDDEPVLAKSFQWHCKCGQANYAPRYLLDIDNVEQPARLRCDECQKPGCTVSTCNYPDCWWHFFNVDGHHQFQFCPYHRTNDPEHINDIITNIESYLDQDGRMRYAGGQAFLNECKQLDDYDNELFQFLGIEEQINLMPTH